MRIWTSRAIPEEESLLKQSNEEMKNISFHRIDKSNFKTGIFYQRGINKIINRNSLIASNKTY